MARAGSKRAVVGKNEFNARVRLAYKTEARPVRQSTSISTFHEGAKLFRDENVALTDVVSVQKSESVPVPFGKWRQNQTDESLPPGEAFGTTET